MNGRKYTQLQIPPDHHHSRWHEQRDHPLFVLYGSLREGKENRFLIGLATETIALLRLPGFAMYVRADYPYVVATGDPAEAITVELVRITDPSVVERMCEFESREGYLPVQVRLGDFSPWLFIFSDPGEDRRIPGGDWASAGIP